MPDDDDSIIAVWRYDASGARWMSFKKGPHPASDEKVAKFVLWMMEYARSAEHPAPSWDEVVEEVRLLAARNKCRVTLKQIEAAFAPVPLVLKNKRGRRPSKWPKPAPEAE